VSHILLDDEKISNVLVEMVFDFFNDKAARMFGYQAITLSHVGLPSRRIL
jgi:hypothetical protein